MINFWHLTILLQLIVVAIGLLLKKLYRSVDYKTMVATGTLLQFAVSMGFILAQIF